MVADGHHQSQQGAGIRQILDREAFHRSHRSILPLGYARLLHLPFQRPRDHNECGAHLYHVAWPGDGVSLRQKQDRHGGNSGGGNHDPRSASVSGRRREEAFEIARRASGRTASLAAICDANLRDGVISPRRSSCCSWLRRAIARSCYWRCRRRCSRDAHGKSNFRRNASLLSDDIFLAAVARPDAFLAPLATSPLRLPRLSTLEKKFATSANWSLERQITYRKPILGTTSSHLNTKP